MKRILCLLLTLVLLLPNLAGRASAVVSGDCGDDLVWSFEEESGTLTVSGTGQMFSYAWEDAPWCAGGMDVQTVVLEEGVTDIGSYAFRGCTGLTAVSLPASLTAIGEAAFSECDSLAEVHIADLTAWMGVSFAVWYEEEYVESAGAWQEFEVCSNPLAANSGVRLYVYGTAATAFSLPEGIESVGSYAFWGYEGLTGVVIPDGVVSVGMKAFENCTGLKSITLPDSVKTFGDYAFNGCSALTDVYYPGTPTQVAGMKFGQGNKLLINASWHFGETHTHSYGDWEQTKAPNCTEPGEECRYCEGCDHYETREVEVTEHIFGDWEQTNASTTAQAGRQQRTCIECETAETRDIPMIPTVKISANTTTGKPRVTWSAIDGADIYRIYRATSKSGSYSRIKSTSATSFTDTTAEAGTNYYYKIKAVNSETGVASPYSGTVNRVCDLSKPTVSLSVNTTTGKPVVKWETVEGAAKYRIYRATSKTGSYKLVYTGIKARRYEDATAAAGTNYYYKVRAIHEKSAANSAYSAIVNRVCDLPKPVVTVTLTTGGNPYLKWSTIDGTLRYRVYRATSKSGDYDYIGYATAGKYIDKDVTAGTKYYYKVKAVHENSNANSAYSSVKYITAE